MLLVVVAFLAERTGAAPVGAWQWWLWAASVVALVIAAVSVIAQLWPRAYLTDTPQGLRGWLSELRAFHASDPDPDARVEEAMHNYNLIETEQRISHNAAANDKKQRLLAIAFRSVWIALGLNLLLAIISGL